MNGEFLSPPRLELELTRNEIDTSLLPISDSRAELEAEIEKSSEANAWGYFANWKHELSDFPACAALVKSFQENVINVDESLRGLDFKLAFIRLATNEPDAAPEHSKLHLDVGTAVELLWNDNFDRSLHVVRLLYNLAETPRRLLHASKSYEELVEEGHGIDRYSYDSPVPRAEELELAGVEIPAIEEDAIHSLRFASSKLFHVGYTGPEGHFLISYGAYATPQQLAEFFNQNRGEL